MTVGSNAVTKKVTRQKNGPRSGIAMHLRLQRLHIEIRDEAILE
jgi:hypothetical protein